MKCYRTSNISSDSWHEYLKWYSFDSTTTYILRGVFGWSSSSMTRLIISLTSFPVMLSFQSVCGELIPTPLGYSLSLCSHFRLDIIYIPTVNVIIVSIFDQVVIIQKYNSFTSIMQERPVIQFLLVIFCQNLFFHKPT